MTARRVLLSFALSGVLAGALGGAVLPATAQAPDAAPEPSAGAPAETGSVATVPSIAPATTSAPEATTAPATTSATTQTETTTTAPSEEEAADKPRAKRDKPRRARKSRRERRERSSEDEATRGVPPACAKLLEMREKGLAVLDPDLEEAAEIRDELIARCETQRERQSKRLKAKARAEAEREENGGEDAPAPTRTGGGAPTVANPTTSVSAPGPAPLGVPNFFIDKFRIPPFLLPIYQAAGIQYGVEWQVLAAINEIETDYGRNLNVSSAGALGWMQFIPSSWKAYGVDANEDGRKDPYNPVDAIFAAARYLKAAGAEKDIKRAIFAYNHADWYVDSVMLRAKLIGGLPNEFVGSLTGLTEGRFPVHAQARYADDISERAALRKVKRGQNAATPVEANEDRRSVDIFAKDGSPVLATNDGVIKRVGESEKLGRYVVLRDTYGNTYTYAHLGRTVEQFAAPKPKPVSREQIAKELDLPSDPKPDGAASATDRRASAQATTGKRGSRAVTKTRKAAAGPPTPAAPAAEASAPQAGSAFGGKVRLFANPTRPGARQAGGDLQLSPDAELYNPYLSSTLKLKPNELVMRDLKPGAKIVAGTIIGRLGKTVKGKDAHLEFAIRPAGRGAPAIDPKPILDGWKLLESTAIYRAEGRNALYGPDAKPLTIGQILLMSKEQLTSRVLADPRIDIYECGRRDIRAGEIDRRVLATLAFLASSGLKPSVSSLRCGHGYYTKSGNVSHHSSGNAVDIPAVNGVPVMGHQGEGSVTELAIRRLLTLQGTMKPAQIISLMTFDGADNTIRMADHDDHIHVGFAPYAGSGVRDAAGGALKPKQWAKLIDRLSDIDNPTVRTSPSKYSLPAGD